MKKPGGGRVCRRYADSVVIVHVKEFPVNALLALRVAASGPGAACRRAVEAMPGGGS
jgi:hypothetical protein